MACYKQSKIDVVIAKQLGISYERIKNLKGMHAETLTEKQKEAFDSLLYEAEQGNEESLQEVIKLLKNTLEEARKFDQNNVNLLVSYYAEDYIELSENLPVSIREDAIELFSYAYSLALDIEMLENQELTRKQVAIQQEAKLWKVAYNMVFELILPSRQKYLEQQNSKDLEKFKEYSEKIKKHSRAILSIARIHLRDTEGLRLGVTSMYDEIDENGELQLNDDIIDNLLDPENSIKESWQELKDRVSAFSQTGLKTRAFLSRIPEPDSSGQKQKLSFFGTPKFQHPAKIHSLLLKVVSGSINRRHMINKIKKYKFFPEIVRKELNKILTEQPNEPEHIRLFRNQLLTSLYVDLKRSKQLYSLIGFSFKNGARQIFKKILNKEKYNIANRYLSERNYSTNTFEHEELNKQLTHYQTYFNSKQFDKLKDTFLYIFNNVFVINTNEKLGNLKTDSIKGLVEIICNRASNGDNKALKDLEYIFKQLTELEKYVSNRTDKTFGSLIKGDTDSKNNKSYPFSEFCTRIFSTLEDYSEESLKNNGKIKQSDGKTATYSTFVTPSWMTDFIDTIKSYAEANDKQGLKTFLETVFLNNPVFANKVEGELIIRNELIRDLYNWCVSTKPDNSNILVYIYDYERTLGHQFSHNVVEDKNITEEDHYNLLFSQYVLALENNSFNGIYTQFPVFIMGDATAIKMVPGKKHNVSDDSSIWDEFDHILISEINRIKSTDSLNKALQKSYKDKMRDKEDSDIKSELEWSVPKNLSKNKHIMYFYKAFEGMSIEEIENLDKDERKNKIKQAIKEEALKFAEEISNNPNVKLDTIVRKYNEIKNVNISNEDFLIDYFINYKLATICQLQMFTISPAFYKDSKEVQKRFKQVHASGTTLDIEAVDPATKKAFFDKPEDAVEKCIYFKDIERNPEIHHPKFMETVIRTYAKNKEEAEKLIAENIVKPLENKEQDEERLNKIKKLLGEDFRIYKNYRSCSLTDGQAYRTLDSYRKLCIMADKWKDEHEAAYQEIVKIRKKYRGKEGYKDTAISNEDLRKIEECSAIFQPLKPYMYDFEYVSENAMPIPVQHKYAEIVLIPELLPVNSLSRDMAYYMEEHEIDLCMSDACVKVGAFGQTDISDLSRFGKDSNRDNLNEALDYAFVHKFPFNKRRIQTNVPNHNNSDNQLFGTQPRKLIMGGMTNDTRCVNYLGTNEFNYFGQKITGKNKEDDFSGDQIIMLYNSLICANIWESFNNFDEVLSDLRKLSQLLSDNVIGNSRVLMDRLVAFSLTGDDRLLTPLNDQSVNNDALSLIFSIFRKHVNKQKIKGGSLVQASSLGLKGYEEVGDLEIVCNADGNMLYEECEVPFMLDVTDENGVVHKLRQEDWCNEDGTLILSTAIDPSDPEYEQYLPYKDENGVVYKPLIEEVYPGILNITAYRIPTERGYSMLNLKIKRFSRVSNGGIIKVPFEGTIKAGFDFDIDKLYFMMKKFTISFKDLNNYDIWTEIYKENPEIYDKLLNVSQSYLFSKENKSFKSLEEFKEYVNNNKIPLHKYWKEAGLPGTSNEMFARYVLQNADILELKNLSEYDFTKPPATYTKDGKTIEGNSRDARNNLLLQIFQSRMSDIATIKDRLTPGGFPNSAEAARLSRILLHADENFIEEAFDEGTTQINLDKLEKLIEEKGEDFDPEPNYDPSDVRTFVYFYQQNMVASKVIGIAANQNSNHSFTSLVRQCETTTPVRFGSHTERGLSNLLHPDAPKLTEQVVEFLSSSVDAVKNPVLNYLNITEITASVAISLARLGYSIKEIGFLLTQPIVIEICNYCKQTGTSIQKSIPIVCKNLYEQVYGPIKDLSDNPVKELLNYAFDESNEDFSFATSNKLANNIFQNRKNKDFLKTNVNEQIKIASILSLVSAISSEVNDFISATKATASNSVGSTPGHFYNQEQRIKEYEKTIKSGNALIKFKLYDDVQTPINTSYEMTEMDFYDYMMAVQSNPFAFEQLMFDCNRKMINRLSENKLVPYDTKLFKDVRDYLTKYSPKNVLPSKIIDLLHEDLHVAILMNINDSIFSEEIEYNGEMMSQREYYSNYFPGKLQAWLQSKKGTKYANMPIFASLVVLYGKKGVPYLQISHNVSGERIEDNIITSSWEEAYNNEETREWAIELFKYNLLKTGFTFSPLSFHNLVPSKLINELIVGKIPNSSGEYVPVTYTELLQYINEGFSRTVGSVGMDNFKKYFMKSFVANHAEDYGLVTKVVDESDKSVIADLMLDENQVIQKTITFEYDDIVKLNTKLYRTETFDNPNSLTKDKQILVPMPVPSFIININNKNYLYYINEEESIYGISPNGTPIHDGMRLVYNRIPIIGKTNSSVVYDKLETESQDLTEPKIPIMDSTTGEEIDDSQQEHVDKIPDDVPDENDIPENWSPSSELTNKAIDEIRTSGESVTIENIRAVAWELYKNSKTIAISENGEVRQSCKN